MGKKILLYFGDFEEKKDIVKHILNDMEIPYQILNDEDLQQTTGYLMGITGFHKQQSDTNTHHESDLMVLHHISEEEITLMNEHMKALAVPMVRKAMLTKHNQHWKVCDLLKEISQEHQYMLYVEKIQTLLSSSRLLVIKEYTKASWKIYENAFYEAYKSIMNQSTLEELIIVYNYLKQAKIKLIKK